MNEDTPRFMKAFGDHLVQARIAAGLSLDDIHEHTRISRKNLLLLEAGDFPAIPQTYVRAFVREYARVVGLNEEETIELYNEYAERHRGIPPPPETIDSSNLLLHIDDTVEFVASGDRSASPIEVNGIAEAVDDEYVPKIRKSTYVGEDSATPIDIRTSPATDPPLEHHVTDDVAKTPNEEKDPTVGSDQTTAESEVTAPSHSTNIPIAPSSELRPHAVETTDKEKLKKESPSTPPVQPKSAGTADTEKTARTASTTQPPPPRMSPSASDAPRAQVHTRKTDPPDGAPSRTVDEDTAQERRTIGIGLVVIAMIAVAIYGIYFFSFREDTEESSVDSTAILARIEAGRFIDSTQAALTELELPLDTIPTDIQIPPEPIESKPTMYARDDSLVLEAFTNAPVWFSVKMDTLRTERGSLSSNEHRSWKAREYFVVTLGDAGAVTFFLNGREIGTLGEEGTVIKNVVLSRSRLRGD